MLCRGMKLAYLAETLNARVLHDTKFMSHLARNSSYST